MNQKTWKIVLPFTILLLAMLACNFSASTAKIESAEMARDSEGTQPTTTFSPTDTFYCNVDLRNAPDDTVVRAVWTAVDVEGVDANTEIDQAEITTGSDMLNFELSNNSPWPAGSYKVDLYLNDELDRTIEFTVQ